MIQKSTATLYTLDCTCQAWVPDHSRGGASAPSPPKIGVCVSHQNARLQSRLEVQGRQKRNAFLTRHEGPGRGCHDGQTHQLIPRTDWYPGGMSAWWKRRSSLLRREQQCVPRPTTAAHAWQQPFSTRHSSSRGRPRSDSLGNGQEEGWG